eukprot:TRINITY_DN12384_c0_g4_i2.p1 TRINITY_DN12384_c0_g4~~TRINITY_DN12384_c0_g4_i2.p1  ORF type:complete len:129 (+),score=13.69 TRINITY_DN12384_c0_g4_i2:331-717(+)
MAICCLIDNGVRCDMKATSTSLTKKMKRGLQTRKNLAIEPDDECDHERICDEHRRYIATLIPAAVPSRDRRKRRVAPPESEHPQANFHSLSAATLRRYKRYYKMGEAGSKQEMLQVMNEAAFLSQLRR